MPDETTLFLTVPVRDIVIGGLRQLKEIEGLDRDEAYLLARLESGESLLQVIAANVAQGIE